MTVKFKESLGDALIFQSIDNQMFIEFDPGYHGSHYILQPITSRQLERYKTSKEDAIQVLLDIAEEYGNTNYWDQFEKPDDYDQP